MLYDDGGRTRPMPNYPPPSYGSQPPTPLPTTRAPRSQGSYADYYNGRTGVRPQPQQFNRQQFMNMPANMRRANMLRFGYGMPFGGGQMAYGRGGGGQNYMAPRPRYVGYGGMGMQQGGQVGSVNPYGADLYPRDDDGNAPGEWDYFAPPKPPRQMMVPY